MRKLLLLIVMPLLLIGGSLLNAQEETPPPDSSGLIVSEVLPAPDSSGIDPEAVITVIFNRPIVPLMIAEDMANLPNPISVDPPIEGEGEWLNTSIYVFRPTPALAGGTTYTITVDDVTAADGSTLAAPFSWSFTTVEPAVSEVFPNDGETDVLLNGTIQVRFNQPVDRDSAEAAFLLRDPASGDEISGAFSWADDSAGFRFRPDGDLELETLYEAGFLENTVVSINGGAPMAQGMTWTFETVPFPAIQYTQPQDGDTEVYPWGGFTIYFASPMDVESIEGKITIEPEPWREYDSYYGDWDNSYTISFPTEPSTEYTITIAPGMLDLYGNEITEGQVINYTTAPYDSDVNLQAPGSIGFYNAYNEQTQVYLTHLNVSQVDLSLYRVLTDDFIRSGYDLVNQGNDFEQIRSWTIPNVAPENARRYELLDLGGSNNIECPGAPNTRLQVGDSVVVVATDSLRARATAPDGEVLTLLYADYRMPIVAGPVCADNIVWWQVRLRDERLAWVAEGVTGEYFIELADASEQTPVPVTDENGEPLPPGVYYLEATSPETTNRNYTPVQHILIVGTANITLKAEIDTVTAWVTDVNTGEPISDAPLTVYTQNQLDVIGEGTTDADGIAVIPITRQADLYSELRVVLDDGENFSISFTSWSDGIEGWYFGMATNYYDVPYRAYLYTDRPLYRPNQPVYFRGIVRSRDDVRYPPSGLESVPVQILDPEGQVIYEADVELTPFGTFDLEFDLAEDAALGYYQITVTLPQSEYYYDTGANLSFGVAEYRLPEYQVNLTPAQLEELCNAARCDHGRRIDYDICPWCLGVNDQSDHKAGR